MTGIQYITDQKGKRIGVQIDLRKHAALWEDFCDAMLAEQSAGDALIPWAEAKRQLHTDVPKQKQAAKRQHTAVKRSKVVKK